MPLVPAVAALAVLALVLALTLLVLRRRAAATDAKGAGDPPAPAKPRPVLASRVVEQLARESGHRPAVALDPLGEHGLTPEDELRTLRWWVRSLTEALGALEVEAGRVIAPLPEPAPARVAGDPTMAPSLDLDLDPGLPSAPLVPAPSLVPPRVPTTAAALLRDSGAPAAREHTLVRHPLPPQVVPPTDEPGPTPRWPDPSPYAELSQVLAEDGEPEAAALARWAADLRTLHPVSDSRAVDLADAMETLPSGTPTRAVEAGRTLAAQVCPEAAAVLSLMPALHLDDVPRSSTGRRARRTPAPEVAEPVGAPWAAFVQTLEESAELAGDHRQVSVTLRRRLALARLDRPGNDDDYTVEVLREVLEQHEHAAFDAALETSRTVGRGTPPAQPAAGWDLTGTPLLRPVPGLLDAGSAP